MTEISLNPQQEAERAIIGHVMVHHNKNTKRIIEALPSGFFYFTMNKTIWSSIKEIHAAGHQPDIVTVSRDLNKKGFQQFIYALTGYTSFVPPFVEQHATYLVEQYLAHTLKKIAQSIISVMEGLNGSTALDIYDNAKKKMDKAYDLCIRTSKKINGNIGSEISKILDNELDQMEQDLDAGTITGISYGIPGMDGKVDLMVPGDMIVIASRPGMGKTIMAVQIAIHAALTLNIPVDFHSLEMTRSKIAQRILAMFTQFTTNDILYRKLSKTQITSVRSAMKSKFNENLKLYDDASINVDQINKQAEESRTRLIILDYLQLVEGDKTGFRESEVSGISRGIKKTAMERKVPFIALSQLSRKVEERGSTKNKPQLSDLRESGSIEQDADTVIFPYRPDYYGWKDANYPKNITQFIVAKQRNGAKPTIPALFDETTNQFIKYENDKNNPENTTEEGFPQGEAPGF